MKMTLRTANNALAPKGWRVVGERPRYRLEILEDGEWISFHRLNIYPVFRSVAEAFVYATEKSEKTE